MKTVCEKNKCAGCMACVDICPKGAIKIKDELSAYNAIIQENKCISCNACHNICQNNYPVNVMGPKQWYQGWAKKIELREKSSSGGFAIAISEAFIDMGGKVCSCVFKNGKFTFEFAERKDELKKYVGSKYVKSNPECIYREVKNKLKDGEKILFIGLPCQVAAMKKFIGERGIEKNLYTIDLICHGTPSPELLELFLKQYQCTLAGLEDLQFRVKTRFMINTNHKGIITDGVSDKYSIAFLNSLIYTENCYSCLYARKERVSDLTLGDSWGSELETEEKKKGISLALSQTEKGDKLLNMSELHLEPVNINKAIASNHQLEYPSVMPEGRKQFFKKIGTKKFNSLVFYQLPKQCLRQDIKEFLIKTKIIRRKRK